VANRPLVLSVSADTTPLQRALDAGRTTLAQFGLTASASIAEVEAAFASLAASPANAARQMEQSFSTALRNMQNSAQQAASMGSNYDPLGGMTSKSSGEASARLLELAQVERDRAAAAAAATTTDAQEAQVLRVLATASTAAALAFEEQAAALKVQANVLGLVETQQLAAGPATQTNTNAQTGLHDSTNRLNLGQMELAHVARASVDAWAAGIPISRIAAMEMGRLAEAMSFYAQQSGATTGIMGKFAAVMSGPWAIALTIGIPLLASLVGHLLESKDALGDATKKLEEQGDAAKIAAQAQSIYDKTIDGLIAKETKLAEVLERQLKTREQLNQEQVEGQKIAVVTAQSDFIAAAKAYDQAKEKKKQDNDPKLYISAANGGTSAYVATMANDDAAIHAAAQKLVDANTALADSRHAQLLAEATDAKYKAQVLAGPNGKAILALDAREQANYERYLAKQETLEQYLDEQIAIDKRRAELGKTANAKAGPTAYYGSPVEGGRITGQFGEQRKDHVHAGVDIAVPVGTPVKAVADGVVTKAGLMGGYGNVIIINTGGAETRDGHLSRFNVTEGQRVKIGDIIGYSGGAVGSPGAGDATGPHVHHEVRVGGHAVKPFGRYASDSSKVEDETEKLREQQEKKAQESTTSFTSETDTLNKQLSATKRKQADTIEEQYAADLAALDDQKKEADDRIEKMAAEFGWTDAQKKALLLKEDEIDAAKRDVAKQKEKAALDQRALDDAKFSANIQTQLLNLQTDAATTLKERRDIQHKLLKIERDQAQAAIDADKSLTPQEKADRKAQTDNVFNTKNSQVDQNGDPLQDYQKRLHNNVDDMNSALKGVAADGLQSLEDGFIGVVTGTETVAQAFKKMAMSILADLARIAIEKVILSALGLADGGEAGGGGSGGSGSFLKIIGLADGGGLLSGSGGAREDKIPAMLSAGEFVVNASSTARHRRLLHAINDNDLRLSHFADGGFVNPGSVAYPSIPSARAMSPGGAMGAQPIYFDLRGAVMTEDLLAQMNQISARQASAALMAAPSLANNALMSSMRRNIP
jgi:murein DD-endopeptidase MepM/ murein hydrolase activator NlpD